ncbi:MAG TPA: flagellar hook protein FlgE [bacterium]|nr:flagellar hook protein FlgE [bacterium]
MSIIGAMFSGISGLNANSAAMEIIGNNLANINTPAYKYSRAEFSDVLSKTLSGNITIGRGATVTSTSRTFSQGGFQTTNNVTDLALSGEGFFMVRDTLTGDNMYTRAGNFTIDKNGFIIHPTGYRLQGFSLDEEGLISGVPEDIHVPQAPLEPKPTSEVTIYANLDSNSDYVGPFNLADPVNTSNFTSAITVYDSLGNAHQVTAYFTLQNAPGPGGGQIWDYNIVVGADDSTTGADAIATSGTLEFTTDGALQAHTVTLAPSFNFAGNPAQAQAIDIGFGTSIADGGTGVDGTTQYGSTSALVFQSQDGYSSSYIESIDIDSDGVVTTKYANGESREYARIAVVNFTSPDRLNHLGSNIYGSTVPSGEPVISVANESGNGAIFANTLELSNVDIAQQFVEMITTQRGFQATSRSITTSNEMLLETVNITR